jgi:HEAT repeat protein
MHGQTSAAPVVALLADRDANVRSQAAGVVGGLRDQAGRAQLEALAVGDADAFVRRDAVWALGQLANPASRGALTLASGDPSGLVRGIARAALAQLP